MVQVSNEDVSGWSHRHDRTAGRGRWCTLVRASIVLTAADGEESASLGARVRAWLNAITNGVAALDRSEFKKPSELVGSRSPAVTTR